VHDIAKASVEWYQDGLIHSHTSLSLQQQYLHGKNSSNNISSHDDVPLYEKVRERVVGSIDSKKSRSEM
jgi:hypothetical protein